MDKYSDLPDIDNAGQEVFESSDVESELELPVKVPPIEDVDNNSLDFQQSKDRFVHSEIIDTTSYDFLGNLSRLNGYSVNQVDETIEEKLSRISRELEEIKLQDRTPTITNQVDQLQEFLNLLKNPQIQENSKASLIRPEYIKIDSVFEKIVPQQDSITTKPTIDFQSLVSLEERLNSVETIIGTNDSSKPLNLIIKDLDRKIAIIDNPEYNFEVIRTEINKLEKELGTLEMKRKVLTLDENDDPAEQDTSRATVSKSIKIDELYEKLPTINKYNALAPMLLTRLKTLNKIHHELENSVDLSGSIDQILQDIESDMKNWDESLNTLNQNMTNYEKNFEKNSISIQERINDLILKVESLSTD